MKLLRKIERLEASAEQRAPDNSPVGLVWSSDEHRVAPGQAEAGEYVACDVWLAGGLEFAGVAHPGLCERFTRDAEDLGIVYDAEGAAVGRVMLIESGLIRYVVDSPTKTAAQG